MEKIVLLKHLSKNDDEKLLGFFYLKELEKIIGFYDKLPGFSDTNGKYIKTVIIETDKNILWLLQVWNVITENIILEKIFENKKELDRYMKNIVVPEDCEVTAEEYSVGIKYWTSGYETLY